MVYHLHMGNKTNGKFAHSSLSLSGRKIVYTLYRRKNQKRMYLKISGLGDIRVSAPSHLSLARVETFLLEREEWIRRHLEKINTRNFPFNPEEEILYLGYTYKIPDLELPIDGGKLPKNHNRNLQDLIPCLQRQARLTIPERLKRLSKMISVSYGGVQIRDQRTRWGSSSGRGTISINWRTIMAPEEVIDYLLIHELAHQKKRNHGPDFWKLVKRYSPDYPTHDCWLKKHSFLLDLYRPLEE
jgi:hypothetical protein